MPISTDRYPSRRVVAITVVMVGWLLLVSLPVLAGDGGGGEELPLAEIGSGTIVQGREESAPAGSGFSIQWQTIDGGITMASGGSFELRGTVGQPEADAGHPSQSADFAHVGGFWAVVSGVGSSIQVLIFSDRFED